MKCATEKDMLHYVAGSLPPDRAAALERHVAGCEGCARMRAELGTMARRLQADPGEFEDAALTDDVMTLIRMGRARPAPVPVRPSWLRPVWWLVPAAAALALVVLVVVWPRDTREPDGFRVRSGADDPDRWVSMQVFRTSAEGYQPVTDRMGAGDALAFTYRNQSSAYHHLMVLGVDPEGQVFWYYPAHTREGEDPVSITLKSQQAQLPDEIRHELEPGPLRLFALFSAEPLRVSEVEAAVASDLATAGDLRHLERLDLGATGQHTILLTVTAGE